MATLNDKQIKASNQLGIKKPILINVEGMDYVTEPDGNGRILTLSDVNNYINIFL